MRIFGLFAGVAVAVLMASSSANAFETTSVTGTNPDGSAHYQDPDEMKLPAPLAESGLQFSVKGSGFNDSSDDDSGAPPWQIKPPPSTGFSGSPYSSPFNH